MCTEKSLLDIFADAIKDAPKPSLKAVTEQRAARLSNEFGRLPATHYGWGNDDDDAQLEARLEEEARKQM